MHSSAGDERLVHSSSVCKKLVGSLVKEEFAREKLLGKTSLGCSSRLGGLQTVLLRQRVQCFDVKGVCISHM